MGTGTHGVVFIPEAKADLAVIRGRDLIFAGVTQAARRYSELVVAGHELATFPERFERLPPALTAGRYIRRRPVGHHLLIYRVDEAEARVVVLGHFDSRRAPWRLGALLSRRGSAQSS